MSRLLTASARILTVLALTVAVGACSVLPWSSTRKTEVNAAFRVEDNIPMIEFSYAGVNGDGILSTARERTVLDDDFAAALSRDGRIRIGTEHVTPIEPAVDDLHGLGDALVAADAFENRILTIDWRAGLVTIFTRAQPLREGAASSSWTAAPAIPVRVDGRQITAIIDTANPDSLTLPGSEARRYEATVGIAGTEHPIDIAVDPRVTHPRLGNRILVDYLIQIDYRRKTAALWKY